MRAVSGVTPTVARLDGASEPVHRSEAKEPTQRARILASHILKALADIESTRAEIAIDDI